MGLWTIIQNLLKGKEKPAPKETDQTFHALTYEMDSFTSLKENKNC